MKSSLITWKRQDPFQILWIIHLPFLLSVIYRWGHGKMQAQDRAKTLHSVHETSRNWRAADLRPDLRRRTSADYQIHKFSLTSIEPTVLFRTATLYSGMWATVTNCTNLKSSTADLIEYDQVCFEPLPLKHCRAEKPPLDVSRSLRGASRS